MVEKLGHKKTIRKQRIDWVNEGKPNDVQAMDDGAPPAPSPDGNGAPAFTDDSTSAEAGHLAPIFLARKTTNGSGTAKSAESVSGDDAAVIDLTPRVGRASLEEQNGPMMSGALGGASKSIFGPLPSEKASTQPTVGLEHDELDALIAETEAEPLPKRHTMTRAPSEREHTCEADFADEEAAMAEMEGLF